MCVHVGGEFRWCVCAWYERIQTVCVCQPGCFMTVCVCVCVVVCVWRCVCVCMCGGVCVGMRGLRPVTANQMFMCGGVCCGVCV